MPNRIIREGVLDSPRYMAVHEGAQLFFHHLLLLADDFGCVSLNSTFIGRRCFAQRPTDERLDRLVAELADVDLIRVYEVAGQKYAFIPRFRQRLKRETLKNPMPPNALLADDDDAQGKFRTLNDLTRKSPDPGRPASDLGRAPGGPTAPEVKGSEVKGSEGKGREAEGKGTRSAVDLAADLAARQTRLK